MVDKMNKIVGISFSIISVSFLLYYLALAPSVDIVDDIINQGLTLNTLPDMTAATYLLNNMTMLLVFTFIISLILAFRHEKQYLISLFSLPLAALIVVVVSTVVLRFYPPFRISISNIWVNPYLLAFYIFRNPGLYIVFLSIVFAISLIIIVKNAELI